MKIPISEAYLALTDSSRAVLTERSPGVAGAARVGPVAASGGAVTVVSRQTFVTVISCRVVAAVLVCTW